MSKYIDAARLRAEIEFAKSVYSHPNRVTHGVADAFRQDGRAAMCDDILEKIDSLQQERPEVDFKIEERKWIQDAVDNVFPEDGDFMSEVDFRKILKDTARHFSELGQRKAAEMYDEAEYNRQRAEEEMSDKTLDEAAEQYADSIERQEAFSYGADHYCWGDVNDAFLAGAKWMAGQGAQLIVGIKVNGMGQPYLPPEYIYLSGLELKEGDKVIVQIRKKEESK